MRMFGFFGKKAKYDGLSWWENFMGGHLSFRNLTIYGSNAMCWAVNIHTKKWGYVCFTLPSMLRIRRKMSFYLYLSPNGTPWACTYYLGSDKNEYLRSKIRKLNFGHNFDTDLNRNELKILNNRYSYFTI